MLSSARAIAASIVFLSGAFPRLLSPLNISFLNRAAELPMQNLALACQGCNNHKFTRVSGTDPVTLRQASLYNPRLSLWSEHFAWSDDFIELIGITPYGRATIATLRLNRPEITTLRRVLVAARLHPPDYPYWQVNA
jgi:hypothetical protein